jgi:anti-sigma regulatory factor (Ser/Thr protein kinase)
MVWWTDGVEDLAEKMAVSAGAVACALMSARETGIDVPWLVKASDDILVATWKIQFPDASGSEEIWYRPVLNERYGPEDLSRIDQIQSYLTNSVLIAVPSVGSEALHDIALCTREGLINALRHGCAVGEEARLQLSLSRERKLFRLVIEDEGPGHDFDCDEHFTTATTQLNACHRGLILMRALSTRFQSERKGAKLIMDFACKEI